MSTGSLIFPDIPMGSASEAWYQLSKVLGLQSSMDSVAIPPCEYLGTCFIMGIDLEKMSSSPGAGGAAFTGMSTRNAGDTMRFAVDSVNPKDANATPTRMYITLHFDAILELRAEGCILLD